MSKSAAKSVKKQTGKAAGTEEKKDTVCKQCKNPGLKKAHTCGKQKKEKTVANQPTDSEQALLTHPPANTTKFAYSSKEEYKNAKENMVDIQKNKIIISHGYMMLAKGLYENREKKYYIELGYETFDDFIAIPEISISRSIAYDLMLAYKTFIVDLKFTGEEIQKIDVTKTRAILRIDIPNKTSAKEWLHKADTLSRSDLMSAIREYQGKEEIEHTKRTECNDAWRILKMRLEGRNRNNWFKTKADINSIACRKCGKDCETEDIILENSEFKLIVVKCMACKHEELMIFA